MHSFTRPLIAVFVVAESKTVADGAFLVYGGSLVGSTIVYSDIQRQPCNALSLAHLVFPVLHSLPGWPDG